MIRTITPALLLGTMFSSGAGAQANRFTGPIGPIKPQQVVPLRNTLPKWLPALPAPENDMTGWTQFSEGAAKGGPSVVTAGGSTYVVARGGDDGLYRVVINPLAPLKLVPASSWKSLNVTATSEPNCYPLSPTSQYGCAWLGPNGNAQYMIVDRNEVFDLGGKFDARPAIAALTMKSQKEQIAWGIQAVAMDGARLMKRSREIVYTDTSETPIDTGWEKLSVGSPASIQCDAGMCAWITNNAVGINNPFNIFPSKDAPPPPAGFSKTAPAPVRLQSGKYAVVVRGRDGHIYSTVTDGLFGPWRPWVDQGGTAMPGASIGCVANGEQPVCFVQALDGRLYWKKFATAAGL